MPVIRLRHPAERERALLTRLSIALALSPQTLLSDAAIRLKDRHRRARRSVGREPEVAALHEFLRRPGSLRTLVVSTPRFRARHAGRALSHVAKVGKHHPSAPQAASAQAVWGT